jgi:hypothetical protein
MAVIYYKRYIKEGIPAEKAKADDPKKSDADKQKILAAANEHEKAANERIAACAGGGGGAAGSGSGSGSAAGSGSASGSGSGKGSGSGSASSAAVTTSSGAGTGAGSGSETAAGVGSGAGSASGTSTGAGAGTGSDDTTVALAPSLSDEKPSGRRTFAWISVATSLAAGTVGAVLLLSANSTEKDIEDLYTTTGGMRPPAYDMAAKTRYDQLVDDGNRFNTLAEVSFGVCGAAAITAIVLFATDHGEKRDEHALRVIPTVTPNAAGFTAAFRF